MDHSMKSPKKNSANKSSLLSAAEWEALLARIQSPSKELEATLAKSNSNLIHALSGLDELEKLTLLHLAPPTLTPLASTLPPAPAPAQTQSQPVQYQTSHEEYAPALNQSALVEALLQYQRKKSVRSPKPAPQAKTEAQNPHRAAPAFSRADFAPMRIPAIEAEPKASPLGRSATPSVRLPVLRLKSENSSGNPHDNDDEQS